MPDDTPALQPLQFEPILKSYPWGGRAIGTTLGRQIPPSGPVAESWEISGHSHGRTPVAAGVHAGKSLPELMAALGESLLGRRCRSALARGTFPLLIKVLDAREWLSVQVHPDDEFARQRAGDLGKTEMWIVLEAEPGAEIILGFRKGTRPDEFRRAIEKGTVERHLHRTPAAAGDVFFVPPGTVHAIGPGVLIAEIQQSSNVTYRVFDWNREPQRRLHVAESLEVLDFDAVELGPVDPALVPDSGAELLAECHYFRTERLSLDVGDRHEAILAGASFEIWGSISGSARLQSGDTVIDLQSVAWTLLPADLGAFEIHAGEPTKLLRVLVPSSSPGERRRECD